MRLGLRSAVPEGGHSVSRLMLTNNSKSIKMGAGVMVS